MTDPQTFWNYQPTPARIVRVIVGKSPRPTWWCAPLAGIEREVVEVSYGPEKFYLDNEAGPNWPAGEGWNKVTHGRGGPDWSHAEVPVERLVDEPEQSHD